MKSEGIVLKREKGNFEIRKRKYKGAKTSSPIRIAVVKGLLPAERMVDRLMRNRTEEEKEAGLRFSCHRTTDPVSS
jgi:hypothetical protein